MRYETRLICTVFCGILFYIWNSEIDREDRQRIKIWRNHCCSNKPVIKTMFTSPWWQMNDIVRYFKLLVRKWSQTVIIFPLTYRRRKILLVIFHFLKFGKKCWCIFFQNHLELSYINSQFKKWSHFTDLRNTFVCVLISELSSSMWSKKNDWRAKRDFYLKSLRKISFLCF